MAKENDAIDACDAPLLELQIQISSMWYDRKKLRAEKGILMVLLKKARCPNTSCQDGAVPVGQDPDGIWQAEQCQWCAEREQALKG